MDGLRCRSLGFVAPQLGIVSVGMKNGTGSRLAFEGGPRGLIGRCSASSIAVLSLVSAMFCASMSLAEQPAGAISELEGIASAEKLHELGCASKPEHELPLFFQFQKRDGLRSAVFAAVVPVPAEEAVAILETPDGYPDWFLVLPDGQPNLHAFEVGPGGRGYLQVVSSDGLRLATELERIAGNGIRGVRVHLDAGWGILSGDLLLAAQPIAGCEREASLLLGSLSWRMGWLGRLLPNSIKSLPGALALSIRDQWVAHLVSMDERFVEALMAELPEGKRHLRLLTLRPLVLSGEGRPVRSEHLRDFLVAVSGSHRVQRWRGTFESAAGELSSHALGSGTSGNLYEIELVLKRRGYSLTTTWEGSVAAGVAAITTP